MEKIEWMEKYFPKPHQSEDRSGNEELAATIPVSIILQANNVLEPSVMLQISRLLQVQYFPLKLFHQKFPSLLIVCVKEMETLFNPNQLAYAIAKYGGVIGQNLKIMK